MKYPICSWCGGYITCKEPVRRAVDGKEEEFHHQCYREYIEARQEAWKHEENSDE